MIGAQAGSVKMSDAASLVLRSSLGAELDEAEAAVLSGLMKRIDRSATICSIHDCATIEKAVDSLNAAAAPV